MTPWAVQLEQLDAIRRETAELLSDLDNTQLSWRPDAGGWSIAQCLQHVTMVTLRLMPAVDQMIDEARKRQLAGLPGYRRSLVLAWVTRGLEPPPHWRIRTSRELEPGAEFDRDHLLAGFLAVHGELAANLREATEVHPDRARTAVPFAPLLRMTLGQAVEFILAHARRHLWQARQVRRNPGFPKDSANH